MKKCTGCKIEKPKSAFRKASRLKDGLTSQCKQCLIQADRKCYVNDKEKRIARSKARVATILEDFRSWKHQQGCQHCDEDEPVCLDLHHLDSSKKDMALSDMIAHGYSWEKLMKEAEKCIVVCSNCHRKIHADLISVK